MMYVIRVLLYGALFFKHPILGWHRRVPCSFCLAGAGMLSVWRRVVPPLTVLVLFVY